MNLLSATHRLGRYGDIARLLVKYGRSDVVRQAVDSALLDDVQPRGARTAGLELVADLERMGPTFIKLGQLLSTRADLRRAVRSASPPRHGPAAESHRRCPGY